MLKESKSNKKEVNFTFGLMQLHNYDQNINKIKLITNAIKNHITKVDNAASIYESMKKIGTKHMLLFLNFILQKGDAINLNFNQKTFAFTKFLQPLKMSTAQY